MNRKPRHLWRLPAIIISLAVAGAACGSDSSSPTTTAAQTTTSVGTTTTGGGTATTTTGSATTKASPVSGSLSASGATFPKPFYEESIAAFKKAQPGISITYAGGGSGKGRQDLQDQTVDFAGSDGLIKDEDKPKYKGGATYYFPTVAAPITVSYNLGEVNLKLSADTIAKIFQVEVTTWNDPAIAADNPGATLPDTPIVVVHRSDGSGTTENFTKYLVSAAGDAWKLKSGATVEWPASTQAGNGNAGVAQLVKTTAGAIGYVDFSDAKSSRLRLASVKNKAGKFMAPSLEGTSAALAGAEIKDDLSYNPLNAAGDSAYPIAAPTWILTYQKIPDTGKAAALKAFLTYLLTDGQKLAPSVDYAPLPPDLAAKALAQVAKIS